MEHEIKYFRKRLGNHLCMKDENCLIFKKKDYDNYKNNKIYRE